VPVADALEPLPELRRQPIVHVEPLLRGSLPEQELVDSPESPKLLDRRRVIVHAQIDEHVARGAVAGVALDDIEGRRLLPALLLLCGSGLLVPFWPPLGYVLLLSLTALLAAGGFEGLLLSRLEVDVDRPDMVVLSLGEEEPVLLGLRIGGSRLVHLTVRQVWPALVAEGSSTLHGLCRPGEILRLQFTDILGTIKNVEVPDRQFEEALDGTAVPPGKRYVVRRYFQLIRPRGAR